jgi:hypothetical protein
LTVLKDPAQFELLNAKPRDRLRRETYYRDTINALCAELNVERPEYEYRFCLTRQWRMDAAWPKRLVYAEVEGGIFSGRGNAKKRGHTTSVTVFLRNLEKYNQAAAAGWLLIRATTLIKDLRPRAKISKRTGLPLPQKNVPGYGLESPELKQVLAQALRLRTPALVRMEVSQ